MRAATASGLIFVGPAMGGGISSANRPPAKEPEYKPRVIVPNPEARRLREATREAITAALTDHVEFWQEELERWAAEFGAEAVRNLVEKS